MATTSSWRKEKRVRLQLLVVEKGIPSNSFPPLKDALSGVLGSASQRAGHTGYQGVLDEEKVLNDEDDPDG